ncbi:MAG: plasmid maintenance toxin (PemK-like) [Mesorhizobium sp.]|nr:MAG: plasmid maintenance toxin (PemK-like) [Mesorhizobium sp.]
MKIPVVPPVGHVIAYEYLWRSKVGQREDGEKTYPVAVVLARHDVGPTPVAYVVGISHTPPREGRRALEVPLKLKRHIGLDDQPSWIYTDQINVFAWPGPDVRPAEYEIITHHERLKVRDPDRQTLGTACQELNRGGVFAKRE